MGYLIFAAYLAAGFILAVWSHLEAEPCDRPRFRVTWVYCLLLWWFVLAVRLLGWLAGGWSCAAPRSG